MRGQHLCLLGAGLRVSEAAEGGPIALKVTAATGKKEKKGLKSIQGSALLPPIHLSIK